MPTPDPIETVRGFHAQADARADLVAALQDILRIARHDDSVLCVSRIVDVARAALAKALPAGESVS